MAENNDIDIKKSGYMSRFCIENEIVICTEVSGH
jgi:hypothetical protein